MDLSLYNKMEFKKLLFSINYTDLLKFKKLDGDFIKSMFIDIFFSNSKNNLHQYIYHNFMLYYKVFINQLGVSLGCITVFFRKYFISQ